MAASQAYRAPSVARALKILELVADSASGLGISELARRLEISKGTVFGICSQLESHGALVRNSSDKSYSLGPLMATLANRGLAYTRLKDAAAPEMTALRDRFSQPIFLGVATQEGITVVDAAQPSGVIGISAGPGTKLPLTAGATGMVFLAGLPPKVLDEVIKKGLPAHTPGSIVDARDFLSEIDKVRAKGFAMERDQYLTGVWGAAAGLGAEGGLPAALWSVGFNSSLKPGGLTRITRAINEAALRIRKHLST